MYFSTDPSLLLCPLQLLLLIFPSVKKVPSCNSKFKMVLSRVDLLISGLPRKNELTLRRGHQFQWRVRITAGTNIPNKGFFC